MLKRKIVVAAFSLLIASTAEAARGPGSPIRFGLGTEIKTVGKVDRDSEIGREMDETGVSVALAWDWFWIALPVWSSNRTYLLHEDVEFLTDDTPIMELKEQSREGVSRITGVSESDLTFPFYAYLPPGWIALAALVVIANFISGPSPKKRFARLTTDDDYVRALKLIVQQDNAPDDEDVSDHNASEIEAETQSRFDNAVSHLVSQGISESKAQRNLQFLLGYLYSHPDVTIP